MIDAENDPHRHHHPLVYCVCGILSILVIFNLTLRGHKVFLSVPANKKGNTMKFVAALACPLFVVYVIVTFVQSAFSQLQGIL